MERLDQLSERMAEVAVEVAAFERFVASDTARLAAFEAERVWARCPYCGAHVPAAEIQDARCAPCRKGV